MPRKTFTAGEVLAAADVNNFLMDQSVMTFADSDARGSAIPTPSEGMVTYLEDTDALELFDGSSFVPVASASDAGLEHILTRSVSAISTESFNDVFSSDFDNYLLIFSGSNSESGAASLRFRASGADNSANQYVRQFLNANDTTIASGKSTATSYAVGTQSTSFDSQMYHLFSPFKAEVTRIFNNRAFGSAEFYSLNITSGVHNVSSSFDGFSFSVAAGSYTGTFSIYGYRKS